MFPSTLYLSILRSIDGGRAFSTLEIWFCVFQSREFHPCALVPCFPVPSFPPLRFGPTFSSPALSTPVFFVRRSTSSLDDGKLVKKPSVLERPIQRIVVLVECNTSSLWWMYTLWVKKTRHLTLAHNFTKYLQIFEILSLLDSVGNL